jgi:3,5-epimerase/4-reductase
MMLPMTGIVFGARGYIGSRLAQAFPGFLGSTADIADQEAVQVELKTRNPAIVINCAGKSGFPNIDWCEDHKRETLRSNVLGPLVLLNECLTKDIRLVHIGSACVFDGDNDGKGHSECDAPNFSGSYYARTKAVADRLLLEHPVLVLRLRMPFDDTDHSRSLISRLLNYPRVVDSQNSMTYVPDFVAAAVALIERGATGVYHLVNPGTISPFEIVCRYKAIVDPTHACERLPVERLSEVVRVARSNCKVVSHRIADEGITMRPIQEAVDLALKSLARR